MSRHRNLSRLLRISSTKGKCFGEKLFETYSVKAQLPSGEVMLGLFVQQTDIILAAFQRLGDVLWPILRTFRLKKQISRHH